MKKMVPAANPDAYVASLSGWQRELVTTLRAAVRRAAQFDEVIKWGHLVYFAGGPVLLIRAEESRVLYGFWRGRRLLELEPRLRGGGKYEMASLELREGDRITSARAKALAAAAAQLNAELGDPTAAVMSAAKAARAAATNKTRKSPKTATKRPAKTAAPTSFRRR
jgi:hypothetical protein